MGLRQIISKPFIARPLDLICSVITVAGAGWMRLAKFIGLSRLPITRSILFKFGVFPIVDHYYEPFFRFDKLDLKDEPRELQIDWNDEVQMSIANAFNYKAELEAIPLKLDNADDLSYHFNNTSYDGYDAEYLYSIIRYLKPKRVIEIGSGYSTRLMKLAADKNKSEHPDAVTQITCVEPYEMPWLEKTGLEIVRKKVEDLPVSFFKTLEAGDILFIDSSHMVRPHGDVLYELFNILPHLNPGVVIHIHDIFTPFDYPAHWFKNEYRMWNEQYLVEAFLMHNKQYEVIGALGYLGHKHPEIAATRFPHSIRTGWSRGSAMWIRKLGA